MRRRFPAGILLIGLLAACGRGGTGAALSGEPMEYVVRDAAFESLVSRLEDSDPTVDLPGSGTADYAGFLGAAVALPGGAALFLTAEAEMTARFGEGTVSGGFSRFFAQGGGSVPGSATLSGGRIGVAGITADLSGQFAAGGADHTLDGTFTGSFLGPGAQSAVGVVDATVSAGGPAVGSFAGEVWLER